MYGLNYNPIGKVYLGKYRKIFERLTAMKLRMGKNSPRVSFLRGGLLGIFSPAGHVFSGFICLHSVVIFIWQREEISEKSFHFSLCRAFKPIGGRYEGEADR